MLYMRRRGDIERFILVKNKPEGVKPSGLLFLVGSDIFVELRAEAAQARSSRAPLNYVAAPRTEREQITYSKGDFLLQQLEKV